MVKKLTAISLFSGAGGLDVGFDRAGFHTVFANEFDHDAANTWRANRQNISDVMVEGDILAHIDKVNKFAGSVDVLFAGPPCQGFSVAGKMDPSDTRSEHVFTYLDAVNRVKPKVFVMENVAALGSLARWASVRERIISIANDMGYNVAFNVWHTCEFGVPQNRDRVIFVGILKGDPADFSIAMKKYMKAAPTARQILLSVGAYGSSINPETCTAKITLAKNPVLRASPYAGMLVNGAGRPICLDKLPPTLPATMGGNKTPIVDQQALNDPSRQNWFESYHELVTKWHSVKPLINSKCSQIDSISVPNYLRRISIKEAAAIQTFPNDYIFKGAKSKQYRQIGNAVPSLFAEAVARSVIDCYLA
ncbi:MAG: DNA cytosine methyltransferase [Anaerobiospirillum succiniciproducens]|uniref:DNA cytosine methyltransferase n=1 Tax=Anaerobiospirillum succiniciproducens TaxID=13335 RepID=UPI0026DC33CB|nr:DNA cytosine methyltransferase [Anaerobiospirillum succiniciproducens]MDO4676219.1 DNA cytosine methyltransferase [Anaerobiospirillum succiniciproducens]